MNEPSPPNSNSPQMPPPLPPMAYRNSCGVRLAKLSFWSPFVGLLVFVVPFTTIKPGATGHPLIGSAVIGVSSLIFSGGLFLAIKGLRRMKAEGRKGILGSALTGLVLNAIFLILMACLIAFLVHEEVQARKAREKALVDRADRSFVVKVQELERKNGSAWSALTNPPVLGMALVKHREELQAREDLVREAIAANKALEDVAENGRELYRRELLKYKISDDALAASLKKFDDETVGKAPFNLKILGAYARTGNAALKVLTVLEVNWGKWEYKPGAQPIKFQQQDSVVEYNNALKEYKEATAEALRLNEQMTPKEKGK